MESVQELVATLFVTGSCEACAKRMDIVIVSDEGYIQHAGVMLASLLDHHRSGNVRVFLFTDSVSSETETRLRTFLVEKGGHLEVRTCPMEMFEKLPVGQWSPMMYLKLLLPTFLPSDCHRCLFLDGDMIVCEDLKSLWEYHLPEGKVIAACEDMPDCVTYKSRLGLSDEDICINSGVMVCDMDRWREEETQRPMLAFVHEVADRIRNEQDVLAMYFRNAIEVLPIRWNMVNFYFQRVPNIFSRYLPQLREARLHPAIIHFCAPIKPWFSDCNHPYGHLYRKYLASTPWAKIYRFPRFEHLSARQRLNKMVRNLLNRLGFIRDSGFLLIED